MASTVTELLRRRFGGKKDDGYIKDGLVFLLDGIDKGTTDTTKWVDLIGGIEFTEANGNNCHGTNYIECNHVNYLVGNTILDFPTSTHTIEVAFYSTRDNFTWGGVLLTGNNKVGILSNADSFVVLSNKYKYKPLTLGLAYTGNILVDFANSTFMHNGTTGTATSGGFNQIVTYPVIGALKSTGDYILYGNVYAVRIYNRLLSTDEMLHNQRIDNERFQLGLTI